MNYSVVKSLILKDWYFQRVAILLSLAGGAASLAIIAFGGQPGFILGLILLITIMVLLSATAVIGNTVGERENHTLPFVMTLPISYLEYTTSKIIGSLLIYVPFWLAMVAACLGLILVAPPIHGLFAFTVIMAVEILVSTCLMIAVGLVSESKNWTVSAMITGNVALNVAGYLIAHIPAIGNGMWRKVVQWSPTATILLAIEFALIALMLGGTFFIQSRKKDFI